MGFFEPIVGSQSDFELQRNFLAVCRGNNSGSQSNYISIYFKFLTENRIIAITFSTG